MEMKHSLHLQQRQTLIMTPRLQQARLWIVDHEAVEPRRVGPIVLRRFQQFVQ